MIKAVVTDFSRVLLFPKDRSYRGGLNSLNNKLLASNPNYDFWDYFLLNEDLIDYYYKLNKRVPVFVFTSETIQEHPAIKQRLGSSFSGILTALDFGLPKSDPEIYRLVAKQLEVPIDTVLYVDDKSSNLTQALAAGMQTILFDSTRQTIDDIEQANLD